MSDFTIKTDDTSPALTVTATYSDGTVIDLTGAAATFSLRSDAGVVVVNDATATINAPLTSGSLSYHWIAADTATAGYYLGEFHVTLPDGSRLTVPNDGYLNVLIVKDIP